MLELDVTVAILAQGTDQALALRPASFRQIVAAFCCLLPCSALGLPLAGARCHRSHFCSRYRAGLGLSCRPLFGKLLLLFVVFFLAAHWGYLLLEPDVTVAILAPWLCCRPLFGKLLLLFVVFFLAAHWGYLLLELDVTVAMLAQGTDQSLALLPASFRQIAAAFCCLLPCSALGLPQGTDEALALLPASFRQIAAAFCCLLPCSALGLPLAGARCHRSHFGSLLPASFRQIAAVFCCLLPCSALGLPLA